jgi:hypothetical protein
MKTWEVERKGELTTSAASSSTPATQPAAAAVPPKKKARTSADKAVAGPPEEQDADKHKAKELRKEIDSNLSKAKVLKTRADGCASAYHDIVQKIEHDPAWDFGKTKLSGLKAAKDQLDAVKSFNSFWQEWALSPNFATGAKKTFTTEDFLKHFKFMTKVEAAVSALEKAVCKIRNMFLADQAE